MQPNTTLIAFTDGLVERRGEIIDTGLARLRDDRHGPAASPRRPAEHARTRTRIRGPPRRHRDRGYPMAELDGRAAHDGGDRHARRSVGRSDRDPLAASSTALTRRSLVAAVASITAQRPQRLIFDLTGLSFMDSAGIAVLINTARKTSVVSTQPVPDHPARAGSHRPRRRAPDRIVTSARRFPCRAESVAAARHFIRDVLQEPSTRARGSRRTDDLRARHQLRATRAQRFRAGDPRLARRDPRRGERQRAGPADAAVPHAPGALGTRSAASSKSSRLPGARFHRPTESSSGSRCRRTLARASGRLSPLPRAATRASRRLNPRPTLGPLRAHRARSSTALAVKRPSRRSSSAPARSICIALTLMIAG